MSPSNSATAGASGGGHTAPSATAIAGAANLEALAPILQQLATLLQQLTAAIAAMGVSGGGMMPPPKDGLGGAQHGGGVPLLPGSEGVGGGAGRHGG